MDFDQAMKVTKANWRKVTTRGFGGNRLMAAHDGRPAIYTNGHIGVTLGIRWFRPQYQSRSWSRHSLVRGCCCSEHRGQLTVGGGNQNSEVELWDVGLDVVLHVPDGETVDR